MFARPPFSFWCLQFASPKEEPFATLSKSSIDSISIRKGEIGTTRLMKEMLYPSMHRSFEERFRSQLRSLQPRTLQDNTRHHETSIAKSQQEPGLFVSEGRLALSSSFAEFNLDHLDEDMSEELDSFDPFSPGSVVHSSGLGDNLHKDLHSPLPSPVPDKGETREEVNSRLLERSRVETSKPIDMKRVRSPRLHLRLGSPRSERSAAQPPWRGTTGAVSTVSSPRDHLLHHGGATLPFSNMLEPSLRIENLVDARVEQYGENFFSLLILCLTFSCS